MQVSVTCILAVAIATLSGSAAEEEFVSDYSGRVMWDADAAVVRFESSGSMPGTKEGFFWNVPSEVKRIEIAENVTVRGGFRVGFRDSSNPLAIVGADRGTSRIFGTDVESWTDKNGIADTDKWKYGSISVLADAEVRVETLTVENPRGYIISGYADKSVIHVSDCDLLDTRDGNNNNSDGFIGSAGSSIRNSLISTSDDAIKVYHDITIENVTIEQHRNGAPIQFGWGGETGRARATIRNLTIRGVDSDGLYNMAPFTWEAGTTGQRDVTITGLRIDLAGSMYIEESMQWVPIGLFELKPRDCILNLTATEAATGLPPGIRNTRGRIRIETE